MKKLTLKLSILTASVLLNTHAHSTNEIKVEDAQTFIENAEMELLKADTDFARVHYVYDTYVTRDTGRLLGREFASRNNTFVRLANEAAKFNDLEIDGNSLEKETRRKLNRLKSTWTWNTQADTEKQKISRETQRVLRDLQAKDNNCQSNETCLSISEISRQLSKTDSEQNALSLWLQGQNKARALQPHYQKIISITNDNANTLGFADSSDYWLSAYQEENINLNNEFEQVWGQVKPLYKSLQCHVRAKLSEKYGEDKVPLDKPIPAHLIGDLSGGNFSHLYELVKPNKSNEKLLTNVTETLVEQKVTALDIAHKAESFYTSLGFAPLPETYYQYSQFVEPEDRKVECYPAGWVMDFKNDIRLRMCIKPTGEDFVEVHKQLAYLIDSKSHNEQPFLFNAYSNDGLFTGVQEGIALSMTSGYLGSMGVLANKPTDKNDLNFLMKLAVDKIAALPFNLAISQWKSNYIKQEDTRSSSNNEWWRLREEYQGVASSIAIDEDGFDAGLQPSIMSLDAAATRDFMATISQFQIHQSLCEASNNSGPLHLCSIYNSKEAGKKLEAMFKIGASRPWPEALAAVAGSSKLDGSAIIEYFSPLQTYLDKQNKGLQCD